jgi:aminopeptidase N
MTLAERNLHDDLTIDRVALRIELELAAVQVRTRFDFRRSVAGPLRLDGCRLTLQSLSLNGRRLRDDEYRADAKGLTIFHAPCAGKIDIIATMIPGGPGDEGLIRLGDCLITHCEPEGFRRISFFPDRPSIMCRFDCNIVADARRFPTLLSNGRYIDQRALAGGRRIVRWRDVRRKASYLFALAAGDLACDSITHTDASGRSIAVTAHCLPEDLPYLKSGLETMTRVMAWDEARYHRHYDQPTFNIVVLPDYPGGAMENPTLNLYSTEFFLCHPSISTDGEIRRITASVAHEYLHDWSGNHVGIASWAELALKEGLTVLREQQFMSDQIGEEEARIDDLEKLITQQYPEDDGALAHAVRPAECHHPSNLYTKTVYLKGAEIWRTIATLVGDDPFVAGVSSFFDMRDGSAARIVDMLAHLEQITGHDLMPYLGWFTYRGVATVTATTLLAYDDAVLRIELGQKVQEGEVLPLIAQVGIFDRAVPARFSPYELDVDLGSGTAAIEVAAQPQCPGISLFPGLRAPVRIMQERSPSALSDAMLFDFDPVNRWQASRELAFHAAGGDRSATATWIDCCRRLLDTSIINPGRAARLIAIPSDLELVSHFGFPAIDRALDGGAILRQHMASALGSELEQIFVTCALERENPFTQGARRMRRVAIETLMAANAPKYVAWCKDMLHGSTFMEERATALTALAGQGGAIADEAIDFARSEWSGNRHQLDNWFTALARVPLAETSDHIDELAESSQFDLTQSSRVKSLFDPLATNMRALHRRDGDGYRLVGTIVRKLADGNPRLAARFLKMLAAWRDLDPERSDHARAALESVCAVSVGDLADRARTMRTGPRGSPSARPASINNQD